MQNNGSRKGAASVAPVLIISQRLPTALLSDPKSLHQRICGITDQLLLGLHG